MSLSFKNFFILNTSFTFVIVCSSFFFEIFYKLTPCKICLMQRYMWICVLISFSLAIFQIPNKKIREVHGIARGSTVRARNVGRDIFASLKNIVGGEISEYTRLQAESREQALQRMEDDAKKMGANAIINVRLTTSMVMQGCSEILAYGTAVTVD